MLRTIHIMADGAKYAFFYQAASSRLEPMGKEEDIVVEEVLLKNIIVGKDQYISVVVASECFPCSFACSMSFQMECVTSLSRLVRVKSVGFRQPDLVLAKSLLLDLFPLHLA